MTFKQGNVWICVKPDCRAESFVASASRMGDGCDPNCSREDLLKKPYIRPTFTLVTISPEQFAALFGTPRNPPLLVGRGIKAVEEAS
jgi:hypothetical protein